MESFVSRKVSGLHNHTHTKKKKQPIKDSKKILEKKSSKIHDKGEDLKRLLAFSIDTHTHTLSLTCLLPFTQN